MNFSLLDDPELDELDRMRRENEALGTLLPTPDYIAAPSPAAFQPPPHAEMAPLQIDNGPDWSDALGAGTTALAALADLGLNHGRGTGQILAAGGAFGQARADQRLRQTQDALAYEQKRAELEKSNRYNDYLYASLGQRAQNQQALQQSREGNLALRGRDVAVKEANSARADSKVARETNADSDYAQPMREWAEQRGLIQPGEWNGLSYEQMKAAKPEAARIWEFDHAGERAKATRGGALAADIENADAIGDVKASQAGKIAAAQAPYKVQTAEDSAAARERGQQRGKEQAASGLTIPGLIETDANAATRAKADPVTLRKIQDSGGALATARDALAEMIQIRKQYGTELPGNAKSRFDLAQVAINGALTELGRTGVLSNEERNYYMLMVPNLSLGWTDALRPGGRDIKLEQLNGAQSEFTNLANGKLRAYGYGLDDGSHPPPAASPEVADATGWQDTVAPLGGRSVQSTPDFPGSNGRAGTNPPYTGPTQYSGPPTGSRQHPFPKGGAAAPSGGDTVMMESTNGIVGPVPRDKVQIAISKGWKLVQ